MKQSPTYSQGHSSRRLKQILQSLLNIFILLLKLVKEDGLHGFSHGNCILIARELLSKLSACFLDAYSYQVIPISLFSEFLLPYFLPLFSLHKDWLNACVCFQMCDYF